MKRAIILFITGVCVLFSLTASGQDVTVVGDPMPAPSGFGTLFSVSGSLQSLPSQLSSGASSHNGEVGSTQLNVNYSDVTVDPAKVVEMCCVSDTTKVYYHAPPDSFKVTITLVAPNQSVVQWSSRSSYISSCPSAVTEWDRFQNHVKNHEGLHYDFAKTWFTTTKIKTYFTATTMTAIDSSCFNPDDSDARQAAKDEVINALGIQVSGQVNTMLQDEDQADNTDITDPPGNDNVDTTKGCP